jgi:transposase
MRVTAMARSSSGRNRLTPWAIYGINSITTMPPRHPRHPKTDALRQRGSLNPRPQAVRDPLFASGEFFDPRDLVQVKYEMVRRVHVDGRAVRQSAHDFGFSRPAFYHAQSALAEGGLAALVPKKPGPRRAHKLSAEVMAFLAAAVREEPALRATALAERVQARFGRAVHPRSIERAFTRAEIKRP